MKYLSTKLLGLIATSLGVLVLVNLFSGQGAGGVVRITEAVGAPYFSALILSAILAIAAILFGIRALLFNQLCFNTNFIK